MNPTAPNESRIAALISAYADRAPIDVDPVAMTRTAGSASARRGWRLAGRGQADRPLAWALLAVALLITIVAGTLIAGAVWLRRDPEGIVTERVLVEPFLGLPPEGAAPSLPETGELIFNFYAEGLGSVGLGTDGLSMWLYEDGRLIWQRDPSGDPDDETRLAFGTTEPTTAIIEQRLTPEGVELLGSAALAVGRAGPRGKRGGVDFRVLWYRDDGQLVKLLWSDGSLPDDLANPASWLPPSAWADQRILAYVPRQYAACVYPAEGLAGLPGHARGLILAHDRAHDPNPDQWGAEDAQPCYVVPTETAREFATTLAMSGIRLEEYSSSLSSVSSSPDDPIILIIPVSPDEKPMCLQCAG